MAVGWTGMAASCPRGRRCTNDLLAYWVVWSTGPAECIRRARDGQLLLLPACAHFCRFFVNVHDLSLEGFSHSFLWTVRFTHLESLS